VTTAYSFSNLFDFHFVLAFFRHVLRLTLQVASLPVSHASRAESSARKRKTIEVASPTMEVEERDDDEEEEAAASPESMGYDEDGLVTQP
jgi:uncharacterized radical SAM superfamily Fe-S cluster-containing enzyme